MITSRNKVLSLIAKDQPIRSVNEFYHDVCRYYCQSSWKKKSSKHRPRPHWGTGTSGTLRRYCNIIYNMVVHPYDHKVKLYQDKYLKEDKYNNFRLEIGMHTGTHIDIPMDLTDQN